MRRPPYERRFDWPRSEFSPAGALVFLLVLAAFVLSARGP